MVNYSIREGFHFTGLLVDLGMKRRAEAPVRSSKIMALGDDMGYRLGDAAEGP
jgi:hypothetical protein